MKKMLVGSVILALVAFWGIADDKRDALPGACGSFFSLGGILFCRPPDILALIIYPNEIGLTEAQVAEIRELRLGYLRQWNDLYTRYIGLALKLQNALDKYDLERAKSVIDDYLNIYRRLGFLYMDLHRKAYSLLSEEQVEAYRKYRERYLEEVNYPVEASARLSRIPFTPLDVFTWHLTLADEFGLTEEQLRKYKELREEYRKKFAECRSQLSKLEAEFDQILAAREIDTDLALAKFDQIIELYRVLGYTFATIGCEKVLTEAQRIRFKELYHSMRAPVADAIVEILESGFEP